MSDARPHDEASEVEALTEHDEVQEGAGPDAQEDVAEPVLDDSDGGSSSAGSEATSGADAATEETDATGQPVEDAGTGDASDRAELDAPD